MIKCVMAIIGTVIGALVSELVVYLFRKYTAAKTPA